MSVRTPILPWLCTDNCLGRLPKGLPREPLKLLERIFYKSVKLISVYNQLPSSTQPGHPSVGKWLFWDFLFGGQWGLWFWVGGIQSEQLHVSYYKLYYASLCF